MHICMHAYIHVCIHTYTHAYMQRAYMHISAFTHTCIHECKHEYIYIYIYNTHTYKRIHISAYVYINIQFIHEYKYEENIHRHMYTFICMYKQPFFSSSNSHYALFVSKFRAQIALCLVRKQVSCTNRIMPCS